MNCYCCSIYILFICALPSAVHELSLFPSSQFERGNIYLSASIYCIAQFILPITPPYRPASDEQSCLLAIKLKPINLPRSSPMGFQLGDKSNGQIILLKMGLLNADWHSKVGYFHYTILVTGAFSGFHQATRDRHDRKLQSAIAHML